VGPSSCRFAGEDPRLVAAIVDRVTFNAHIIETGTKFSDSAPAKRPPEPNAPPKPGGAKLHETQDAAVQLSDWVPHGIAVWRIYDTVRDSVSVVFME
jgi:hypothetical protein